MSNKGEKHPHRMPDAPGVLGPTLSEMEGGRPGTPEPEGPRGPDTPDVSIPDAPSTFYDGDGSEVEPEGPPSPPPPPKLPAGEFQVLSAPPNTNTSAWAPAMEATRHDMGGGGGGTTDQKLDQIIEGIERLITAIESIDTTSRTAGGGGPSL